MQHRRNDLLDLQGYLVRAVTIQLGLDSRLEPLQIGVENRK
ncbi:MAG: hypothetical protein V7752_10865 [Halopseudomonas sp.]